MKVKEVYLRNFRVFPTFSASFGERNIILGPNGSGKTTVIEAINYSSVFSPLRTYETDRDLIRVGESSFNIFVKFEKEDSSVSTVFVGYEFRNDQGRKRIKFNDKVTNVVSASGRLKVVPFLIEDYGLVVGTPSWRRKVVDNFLISVSRDYHYNLVNYYKVLRQKNATIKLTRKDQSSGALDNSIVDQVRSLIETYNVSLSKFGAEIVKLRYEMYSYLSERIGAVSGIDVGIRYKSNVVHLGVVDQSFEERLLGFLNSQIDKEVLYGKSIFGPHLDDFVIVAQSKLAKTFLSQGQIRIVSVFFKLLCAEYISKKTGEKPVLLVDDVFGELDESNRAMVLERILSSPYQVVLSFFEVPKEVSVSDFNVVELGGGAE